MSIHLLVVDDSPIVRMIVTKILRQSALPIEEMYQACNGKEALEIIHTHPVDLVLADINMPIMSGAEMIEAMAKDGSLRSIPVIIISSEGSATRIEQLKAKGASAFIRKPISGELITGIISDMLGLPGPAKDPLEAGLRIFSSIARSYVGLAFEHGAAPTTKPTEFACHSATMTFTGAATGRMILVMPWPLCQKITASLLGVDPCSKDVQETAADALRELLSMTCAHSLSEILGEHAVCTLVPEWASRLVDDSTWERLVESPHTGGGCLAGCPILLQFVCEALPQGLEPEEVMPSPRSLSEEDLANEF